MALEATPSTTDFYRSRSRPRRPQQQLHGFSGPLSAGGRGPAVIYRAAKIFREPATTTMASPPPPPPPPQSSTSSSSEEGGMMRTPAPPNSPPPPSSPSVNLNRSFWGYVQEESHIGGLQEVATFSPTSPTYSPTPSDDDGAPDSTNHFNIGLDVMISPPSGDPSCAMELAQVEEVAVNPARGANLVGEGVDRALMVGEELDRYLKAYIATGEIP